MRAQRPVARCYSGRLRGPVPDIHLPQSRAEHSRRKRERPDSRNGENAGQNVTNGSNRDRIAIPNSEQGHHAPPRCGRQAGELLRLRICFREVHQRCGDHRRQDQSAHDGQQWAPLFRITVAINRPPGKYRSRFIVCVSNPADIGKREAEISSRYLRQCGGVNCVHRRQRDSDLWRQADPSRPATGVDQGLRAYSTWNAATVGSSMKWNRTPKLAPKPSAVHRMRAVELTSKYPREYAGHCGRRGNWRGPLSDICARQGRENGPDAPGKHNITEVVDAIVSSRRAPSL